MFKLVEVPGIPTESDDVISEEQHHLNIVEKYSADFFSKLSELLNTLQDDLEKDTDVRAYLPEIAGGAFCGQIALLLAFADSISEERADAARDTMRMIGEGIAKRAIAEIEARQKEN